MSGASLKGLAKVKKTLTSGKTIYYCYAWRGGPLLKNDKGEPIQPGDHLIKSAFRRAHDERRAPSPTDLSSLITLYRGSSDFRRTKLGTRHEYDRYLDKIRMQFDRLSLEELQQPSTRGAFKEWRDSLADTPRTADFAWMVLVRVLSFAKDRGMISVNIAERGGRLYRSTRRDRTWSDADVAAFEAVAPSQMRLAIQLALWTGQRKGDLLRLSWCDFDGANLRFIQSKTKARVLVPMGYLADVLCSQKGTGAILRTSRGSAWTSAGFNTSWRKCCAKAGITDLTFHDLRGTAITRMALAGCTVPEIAAVTGHSLKDVEAILDMHYLGGRTELAASAMRKMVAVTQDQ
ncbi:tyrosine-type recombinase/integrase [Agrobacterium tumefaciens]|uniref:tyrosine-type recombinase/integrase n=1 Tax=Agrobacterium tumefaciens TaxID=358 RepID=UPI0001FC5767|nr:site-specific integrase [Agrobacterium tumefaciens]ADY64416.1 integrase family protein [Agrobacterium tumefaciens]MEA1840747.1 site-specific integrase [Agrobacterium tumefaciens]